MFLFERQNQTALKHNWKRQNDYWRLSGRNKRKSYEIRDPINHGRYLGKSRNQYAQLGDKRAQ